MARTDHTCNKNNGGTSNYAVRPDDKRLSKGRDMIEAYRKNHASPRKLALLLNDVYKLARKGDVKAAVLWLSYVVGKPKESLDITSGDEPLRATYDLTGLSKEELALLKKINDKVNVPEKD